MQQLCKSSLSPKSFLTGNETWINTRFESWSPASRLYDNPDILWMIWPLKGFFFDKTVNFRYFIPFSDSISHPFSFAGSSLTKKEGNRIIIKEKEGEKEEGKRNKWIQRQIILWLMQKWNENVLLTEVTDRAFSMKMNDFSNWLQTGLLSPTSIKRRRRGIQASLQQDVCIWKTFPC